MFMTYTVLLTKHRTMKTYSRMEVYLYTFLTLALGGEWSALTPVPIG
jgi:hypothetical protein